MRTLVILAASGYPLGSLIAGATQPTPANCVLAIGAVVVGIIVSFIADHVASV